MERNGIKNEYFEIRITEEWRKKRWKLYINRTEAVNNSKCVLCPLDNGSVYICFANMPFFFFFCNSSHYDGRRWYCDLAHFQNAKSRILNVFSSPTHRNRMEMGVLSLSTPSNCDAVRLVVIWINLNWSFFSSDSRFHRFASFIIWSVMERKRMKFTKVQQKKNMKKKNEKEKNPLRTFEKHSRKKLRLFIFMWFFCRRKIHDRFVFYQKPRKKKTNLRTIYSINEMKLVCFLNWNNNPNSNHLWNST